MNINQIYDLLRTSVAIAVKLCAPILVLSMVIGLVISIFQAATQIHEQTITFVPKLIVIAVVLLIAGPWMMRTLQDFTLSIFDLMLQ